MKQKLYVPVIKHDFNGTFWNGDKWIMPSTIQDVLSCKLVGSDLDKELNETLKFIPYHDRPYCQLSQILIDADIIF